MPSSLLFSDSHCVEVKLFRLSLRLALESHQILTLITVVIILLSLFHTCALSGFPHIVNVLFLLFALPLLGLPRVVPVDPLIADPVSLFIASIAQVIFLLLGLRIEAHSLFHRQRRSYSYGQRKLTTNTNEFFKSAALMVLNEELKSTVSLTLWIWVQVCERGSLPEIFNVFLILVLIKRQGHLPGSNFEPRISGSKFIRSQGCHMRSLIYGLSEAPILEAAAPTGLSSSPSYVKARLVLSMWYICEKLWLSMRNSNTSPCCTMFSMCGHTNYIHYHHAQNQLGQYIIHKQHIIFVARSRKGTNRQSQISESRTVACHPYIPSSCR